MIVREILNDSNLINDFDFFNDYKDTLRWLRSPRQTAKVQDIIVKLKDAYFAYLDRSRY